jgi:hypothetical protein
MASLDLNNILDGSGNAYHLTLGGREPPAFATNPWSIGIDAMVLNGKQVLCGDGTPYALPNADWTWEFRIKRTTANNGSQQVILGRWGRSSTSVQVQYLCYWHSDNTLNFLQSGSTQLTSGAITDGNAHAVAIVRSSGNYSLYVDGTRVAGPTACGAPPSSNANFAIGDYMDFENAADNTSIPLYGTIGDVRFSDNARYTGASYSVSGSALGDDANTVSLLPLTSLAGTYLGAPVFLQNALIRTGHSQASGGWANPDGIFRTLDDKWAFTVSGYDGSIWTCWAVIADTLADLIDGSGTLQSNAIQSPNSGEGDIAANGSVWPWLGTYYHWYQDGSINVRSSSGSSLNAAFSPQPGNVEHTNSFDAYVQPYALDPDQLEMLIVQQDPVRHVYRSFSSDGTTWSAPALWLNEMRQAGWNDTVGEPIVTQLDGNHRYVLHDGEGSGGRRVTRQATLDDGTNWRPLGKLIDPSGVDAGANPYVAAYDSAIYFDEANERFIVLGTHSTNTTAVQPTNSDIGVWEVPIIGLVLGGSSHYYLAQQTAVCA